MTSSYTLNETFTVTHARHIASRVAGDLRLMSIYYNHPSLTDIDAYLEEIAQLLAKRYLATVEFGFRRQNSRIFTLRYEALSNGNLSDSRSGGVPPGVVTTGATFFSYLTYSPAWRQLSQAQRDAFRATLPVTREPGLEPTDGEGYWVRDDRSYAAGGSGLQRGRFMPR